MKKIVVPTDFSSDAEKAYAVAVDFAKKTDSEIELVTLVPAHVSYLGMIPVGVGVVGVNSAPKNLENEFIEAENQLTELAKSSIFNGVAVTPKVFAPESDDVASELAAYLNRQEHEFMVMGTAGADQVGESFAEIVARNAEVPLITVKQKQEDYNLEKITLATDFKTTSAGFLKRVESIRKAFGATLEILYINTPKQFKDTEYIEREFKRFNRKYHLSNDELTVINAYDVEEGILSYINKKGVDLLAIPTHGRTGFSRFLHGSYTEDIINNSPVPVYSFNLHDFLERNRVTAGAIRTGFTG